MKPIWHLADELALKTLYGNFGETARHPVAGPYGYAGEDGRSRMNLRTYEACVTAGYLSGWGHIYFTQGGLNNGTVGTSSDTHDLLDVADISVKVGGTGKVRPMEEQFNLVKWLDECGVGGMIRGTDLDNINDRMVSHIHCAAYSAQHATNSVRQSLYNKKFGIAYGGAGLGGMTGARWFGPPLKHTDREWADSPYNFRNGWVPSA